MNRIGSKVFEQTLTDFPDRPAVMLDHPLTELLLCIGPNDVFHLANGLYPLLSESRVDEFKLKCLGLPLW